MKIMLLAAAAALSLTAGVAYANEGGPVANTQFTESPGYLAQAAVQNAPSVATAQNGQAVHVYVTQSARGTWLFQAQDGGGANN
jgi:hypothetical protein